MERQKPLIHFVYLLFPPRGMCSSHSGSHWTVASPQRQSLLGGRGVWEESEPRKNPNELFCPHVKWLQALGAATVASSHSLSRPLV